MAKGVLGLQGKFIVALLVAAALPFLVGLAVFETIGYRHLLEERGRYHHMEALTLVRALDQAADAVGGQIHTWLSAQPALTGFALAKNRETVGMAPEEIQRETLRLDALWASLPADDPLLRDVLDNPGSDSLAKFRFLHPAVAEILATDAHGRLISATGKSSDLDQSDEDWWKKGAAMGKGGVWTDVLRFDASSDVFSQDVVLPLYDGDALAGVVKVSVDVTSLFAQLGFDGEEAGERWEIVLPDGWVLASSRSDFQPKTDRFPAETVDLMAKEGRGWTMTGYHHGEDRMTGFVTLAPEGGAPNAYVLFSSRRDDVVAPLQKDFLWLGIAGASLLLLCALAGFYLIHSGILAPLAALGNAARSISATARLHQPAHGDEEQMARQREQAEADLRKIEAIRTGDEVETLAADLAVMTSRVLRYQRELETEVAAKTAVIREDLEMAREFQNALMPSRYPEVPPSATESRLRLKFSHFYQPASTVGGDFFDLIELDNGRAGILIADVMGHGARSALVTAILRALVRNHSGAAADPGRFLTELNGHLHEVISRSGQTLFVTAFFLVLDTREGTASWSVAGHPAPLKVRRGSGKTPQPLWDKPQRQLALGLAPQASYRTEQTPLNSGDIFLLFTDGALEAENPAGEQFGVGRLCASVDEALDGPMAAMPAKIVCDVIAFQKRHQFEDDICLVAVEAASGKREG